MKQTSTVIIVVGCVVGFSFAEYGCDDPKKCEYGTEGCKCDEDDTCDRGLKCVNDECVSESDDDGGAEDSGKGGSGGSGGSSGSGGSGGSGDDGGAGSSGRGGSGGSDGGADGQDCDDFEVCDGEDNDCDGDTDEGSRDEGDECDTGEEGLCAQGVEQCQDGSLVCVQEIEPADEVCDGEDNDCDGDTDEEDPAEGDACDTGESGPCGPGTQRCQDGEMQCVSDAESEDEICDGKDNDCDGQTDETCCDPLDPSDICDADEHCIPQDDDAVPRCVGGAGTKVQNQFCADIDDCVATADCQIYSVDDSTSKICVQQCRIGEDDCADSTETCQAFDPPRMIREQEWGVCKSMPPDAPSGWICNPLFYGTNDGCDCGCEVFDPDCEDATASACDACPPSSCGFGLCVPDFTFVADDNTICEAQPEGWTCPPLTYNDGLYCDCGCGVVDPDCQSSAAINCNRCPYNSCGNELCDYLTFVQDDNTSCLPQQAGWNCPPGYLGDGECDCGCGFVDSDCVSETDTCASCGTGSCDPYDPNDPYDVMCELIDTSHNAVCDEAAVPAEWTCGNSDYLDGFCDCGCNVVDPDCLGNAPSACDFCPLGTCVVTADITCVLAQLSSSDNSQCI